MKNEEKLKTQLLDALSDAVFICDTKGNLTYANSPARSMLEPGNEDISMDKTIVPDILRHIHLDEIRARALLEKGELTYKIEHSGKDKHKYSMELRAHSVDHAGERLIFAICHNITARERLEEQLIHSEKMSSLGTMAATIAHEIKNPLAIIVQGVDFLETSLPVDSELQDAIKMIRQSSMRASRIVKDVLSFARQTEIEYEHVDFVMLIKETISLIERQFSLKGMHINYQFGPHLLMIRVDSAQIKQVIINILANAIEASPDGGTVNITADMVKDGGARNLIRVRFKDTGCGISEEVIQNVFNPFFSTKKKTGGTGLGLFVSKNIIEKHNGNIWIESAASNGTEVIIDLPCS